MSPTAHVPAALQYYVGGQHRTQQINLIGIDPATYSQVSDFGQYLQHPENREHLDFELRCRRLRHHRPPDGRRDAKPSRGKTCGERAGSTVG